jgi:hypothetical protein
MQPGAATDKNGASTLHRISTEEINTHRGLSFVASLAEAAEMLRQTVTVIWHICSEIGTVPQSRILSWIAELWVRYEGGGGEFAPLPPTVHCYYHSGGQEAARVYETQGSLPRYNEDQQQHTVCYGEQALAPYMFRPGWVIFRENTSKTT